MANEKSSDERKKEENSTVEQNLSNTYIPKSKLGDLPVNNNLDKELQKQMDKTRDDIEKFKKTILKDFK